MRSSRSQRARSGETQTRATPALADLAVDQPLLLGEALLDPVPGLEGLVGHTRLLHPVEAEVAGVVAAEVVAAEVPALGAADQLVGLDLALDELVLVLLVVVELEHAAASRSHR